MQLTSALTVPLALETTGYGPGPVGKSRTNSSFWTGQRAEKIPLNIFQGDDFFRMI